MRPRLQKFPFKNASRSRDNHGVSGPGEQLVAPVFVDGKKVATLRGAALTADFRAMVEDYVARRWGMAARRPAAE